MGNYSWGWIAAGFWAGISLEEFPTLKAWEERMWARPALKKGANVPTTYKMKEFQSKPEEVERLANEAKNWVQKGMKDDAKK